MLINEPVEYPGPERDKGLCEMILLISASYDIELLSASPPKMEEYSSFLCRQVGLLKLLRINHCADIIDIFHMYGEISS